MDEYNKIKKDWANNNSEGYQLMKEMNLYNILTGKRQTALMQLASRYKIFYRIAFIMAPLSIFWSLNPIFDGIIQIPLVIYGVCYFLLVGIMDYYLYNAAEGNVYSDIRSKHWSGQVAENRAFFPLNTSASIPDLDPNDAARNFRSSNFFVKDGSYLRLKEVRFAYSFEPKLIKRLGLSELTLSVSAYNLLTFTKYDGFDPEVGKVDGSESNNLSMGVDHGNYPQARSFTFGLQFGF